MESIENVFCRHAPADESLDEETYHIWSSLEEENVCRWSVGGGRLLSTCATIAVCPYKCPHVARCLLSIETIEQLTNFIHSGARL